MASPRKKPLLSPLGSIVFLSMLALNLACQKSDDNKGPETETLASDTIQNVPVDDPQTIATDPDVGTIAAAELKDFPATKEAFLSILSPNHPRVLLASANVAALKSQVKTHEKAKVWIQELRKHAAKFTAKDKAGKYLEPLITMPPNDSVRYLLKPARRSNEIIAILGMIYTLDGDAAAAARAKAELLAIAALTTWNEAHFLDTAELIHGAAIGLDWFYAYLTPAERKTIRDAMIKKGLDKGTAAYKGKHGWTEKENNWNQVGTSALILGSLAIANEGDSAEEKAKNLELAHALIGSSITASRHGLSAYNPGGGYPEGTMYWEYGTRYNVLMLASLRSALGATFGLKDSPGFSETGSFPIYMQGPTGSTFNFGDASPEPSYSVINLWMGKAYNNPVYNHRGTQWSSKREFDHPGAYGFLWLQDTYKSPKEAGWATDKLFGNINVGVFKTAWEDPNATYLAFKGGRITAKGDFHEHLDQGTFVLEGQGIRWAEDLGNEEYVSDYFKPSRRYTYYRAATKGQNTLLLDGQNQTVETNATISKFKSAAKLASAVVDMTAGYAAKATHVQRGFQMIDKTHVLIQDEVTAKAATDILWGMHVDVNPASDASKSDKLTIVRPNYVVIQKGCTRSTGCSYLHARILEPSTAAFSVGAEIPKQADETDPLRPIPAGMKKLLIKPAATKVTSTRIVVILTPSREATEPTLAPVIKPLADW